MIFSLESAYTINDFSHEPFKAQYCGRFVKGIEIFLYPLFYAANTAVMGLFLKNTAYLFAILFANLPQNTDFEEKIKTAPLSFWLNEAVFLASPARVELAAFRLGGERSILLSYGDIFNWLYYFTLEARFCQYVRRI